MITLITSNHGAEIKQIGKRYYFTNAAKASSSSEAALAAA